MPTPSSQDQSLKTELSLSKIIFPLILIIISYLVWMSWVMRVDLFDSFSIYLNARVIATGDTHHYDRWRPPLLPILLAPVFGLDRLLPGSWEGIIISRTLSVAFFGAFLWVSMKIMRLSLSREEAWFALGLMALNRLLIHSAPFTKEDIPSSFFTVLTFYAYLRAKENQQKKFWILASLAASCAVNARFNVAPPLFITLFFYELTTQDTISFAQKKWHINFKALSSRFIYLFVLPASSILIIPTLMYAYAGIAPLSEATALFVKERAIHMSLLKDAMIPLSESIRLNFVFLGKSLTLSTAFLTLIGLYASIKEKQRKALFFLLWLGIFSFIQIFLVKFIESRYQFPFYLPCYYFAAVGINFLFRNIMIYRERLRFAVTTKALKITLFVAFALWPLKNGIQELIRFSDPFYRNNYVERVSSEASSLAGPHKITWIGGMFSLHPKDYIFDKKDKFTYLYHFYNHTLKFFTGRNVKVYINTQSVLPEQGRYGVFVMNARAFAEDQDVLIINPSEESYDTEKLPAELPPLILQKLRMIHFYPAEASSPDGIKILINREYPNAKVEIQREDEGTHVNAQNIPEGMYEVSVDIENQTVPVTLNLVKTENGTFDFTRKNFKSNIKAVALVYYDSISAYFHPD